MNGTKLAFLRKKRNMTQDQLAELLGVSKITVSYWERMVRTPEIQMLVRIADVFDVSTDYLLDRTDDPDSHKSDEEKKKSLDNLEEIVRDIVLKTLAEKEGVQ